MLTLFFHLIPLIRTSCYCLEETRTIIYELLLRSACLLFPLLAQNTHLSSCHFSVLVGTLDNPLYESYLTSSKASSSTTISITSPSPVSPPSASQSNPTSFSIFNGGNNSPSTASPQTGRVGYGHKTGVNGKHVMQLVAHASLDVVEDVQWTNGAMLVETTPLGTPCSCSRLTRMIGSIYRYLKSIDKFHEWTVSVWLTPGGSSLPPSSSPWTTPLTSHRRSQSTGVKIILLHELKNDEGIRLFFQETWENYVKVRQFLPSTTL